MRYLTDLTAEFVREILHYDPDAGTFTWRVSPSIGVRAGDLAGFVSDKKYWKVRIKGHNYLISRLAVLWMTGIWPEYEVDHRDLDKANNRWSNLRVASQGQNRQNRPVRKTSSTGVKGVRFQKSAHGNNCGYYVAQIGIEGKRVYLGSFKTAKAAGLAYETAAKLYHKQFARS